MVSVDQWINKSKKFQREENSKFQIKTQIDTAIVVKTRKAKGIIERG